MTVTYTDDDRARFVQAVAASGNIAQTMRDLGYPSRPETASRWLAAHGLEQPTVDELKSRAVQRRHWFTAERQHAAMSAALDLVHGWLTAPQLIALTTKEGTRVAEVVPTPREVLELARAGEVIVRTLRLIEGQTTEEVGIRGTLEEVAPNVAALIIEAREAVEALPAAG